MALLTRPDVTCMTDREGAPTVDRVMVNYVGFTTLMELGLRRDQVVSVHNDGESMAFVFDDPKLAKAAVEQIDANIQIRFGETHYKPSIKLQGNYLTVRPTPRPHPYDQTL